MTSSYKDFQKTIWDHYRQHQRGDLPWRKNTSPYSIVVSEIMLQQTQVPRVLMKYLEFTRRFPNFKKLAEAKQSEVLRYWKGLGYNSRALRLHKLAKIVTTRYHGRLPRTRAGLITLPGIGPYTAGAIRVFAFGDSAVFIETNIRRVYLHHFFKAKKNIDDKEILKIIEKTLPGSRVKNRDIKNWYWALMDYGSYLGQTLGKSKSNPNVRSKHYTKQSKFKGSDRQIRGRILDELLATPSIYFDELLKKISDLSKNEERIGKIVGQLEKENFLKITNARITLK